MDIEKLVEKLSNNATKVFKVFLSLLVLSLFVYYSNDNSYATSNQPNINLSSIAIVSDYESDVNVEDIDSFTFGMYPKNSSDVMEPIEWIVLERRNNQILALSKYIIDCKCYNNSFSNNSWKDCYLRNWLNNDFYNMAFTDEEKNMIQVATLKNEYVANHKVYDTGTTHDKVFILDDNEVIEFFGYESEKKYGYQVGKFISTVATNYAKNVLNNNQTLWVYNSDEEETEADRINYKWANGNSPFWLRSQGQDGTRAMYMKSSGYLSIIGDKVTVSREGVRPAIWIKY